MQNTLLKNLLSITGLIILTLAVNAQVISYNMMYFEQPLLYIANQHATTLKDLLHIYLHPQFLHYSVPFFRPSGHFLLYFLLTPIFGWHNTQALLIVNLIFLALSGWLIIKIYSKLFPNTQFGGLIAFAIYMLHPAVTLPRFTVMHFEYAYIFLSLASLYVFMIFMEKHSEKFLATAILLFMFAATFKESGLMMGPVLFVYFYLYSDKPFKKFVTDKITLEISLLLTVTTLLTFFYLTWPWQSFFHDPARDGMSLIHRTKTLFDFIKIFFGFATQGDTAFFRHVANPLIVQVVMTIGAVLTAALSFDRLNVNQKKSLLFLFSASTIFIAMPILWSMGLPWHLNPTLLFLSLVFGFAYEKFLLRLPLHHTALIGKVLAFSLASITLLTNHENVHYFQHNHALEFALNKNAVFHPPISKEKLNHNSIIVVEDSIINNPYAIGNSLYPFMVQYTESANLTKNKQELGFLFTSMFLKIENNNLITFAPTYNGTLFKYAYLMPSLREEEFPFHVEDLHAVPNEILYNWLQNFSEILCFGFDKQGHWQDKTILFKKNLLAEQNKRHIIYNTYHMIAEKNWRLVPFKRLILPVPDPQLCQIDCDKQKKCKGFVMLKPNYKMNVQAQCIFYPEVTAQQTACSFCTIYLKNV